VAGMGPQGILATLNGVPLNLTSGVEWSYTYGVEPYARVFEVTRSRAAKILSSAKNGQVTLAMQSSGYPKVTVENLWITSTHPTGENTLGLVIEDARWKLRRQLVTREYNTRRVTGDKRRRGNQLQNIEIQLVVADVAYHWASLNDGKRWTATEILQDIMFEMFDTSSSTFSSGEFRGGWEIQEGADRFAIDIEGLVLDKDPGSAALARVLAYIPGASLYMDPSGKAIVTNDLDGSETLALKNAPPRYRNLPGEVERIDRSNTRPQAVKVYFEPDPEIRFEYDEDVQTGPTLSTSTVRPEKGRELPTLENVLPVVDAELTVNGKTVVMGTWLPINEWIEAVNNKDDEPPLPPWWQFTPNLPSPLDPRFNKTGRFPPLSMALIRAHYLSGFYLMRHQLVQTWNLGQKNVVWERRINALATHFRRTFRIIPAFMAKLRGIRAVRASIMDVETGERGKAEAFFDYFLIPTRRGVGRGKDNARNLGYNIKGYPRDSAGVPTAGTSLAGAFAAPVDVVVVNAEAGIFTLGWRADPWGEGAKLAQGHIEDPDSISKLIAVGAHTLANVSFDVGWKLAVVLTGYPISPNNNDRLLRLDVDPIRAVEKLGAFVSGGFKSIGPEWHVSVGSGVDTARIAWIDTADNKKNPILEAIWGDPFFVSENRWGALFDTHLTNTTSLEAIALASAARVYGGMLDRTEGEQYVAMDPKIVPTGSMSRVSHAILGNGNAITHMIFEPIAKGPNVYSMLPDGVRKVIQKRVDS